MVQNIQKKLKQLCIYFKVSIQLDLMPVQLPNLQKK